MIRLLFLLLIFPNIIFSQVKYDYHWIMGYDNNLIDSTFGVINFNFNSSKLTWENFDTKFDFGTASFNISNSEGQLQFYSNGCYLINMNDQIMKNGDTLNPGKTYQNRCTVDHDSYGSFFNFLCLPKPESINKYLLIHHPDTIVRFKNDQLEYDFAFLGLNYSEIDMNLENGLGAVTTKRKTIFNDTLLAGYMVATKHINNVDWWLLAKKSHSNTWHKLIVTKDSIIWKSKQIIGKFDDTKGSGSGQYCFSKDGKRFATYNMTEQIQVFDFDRSTGILSNLILLNLNDSIEVGGCAFSPSGRFLYVSNSYKVFQFDLLSEDIQKSKTLVGEWDGYLVDNFWPTLLTWIFHGPDCKLYINTFGYTRFMHVINYPDNKGLECNLVQRAIKTKSLISETPKFPHYRTGTSYENYCDTITATGSPIIYFAPNVKVYPNPANDQIVISHAGVICDQYVIYDMLGRAIEKNQISSGDISTIIDISHLQSGMYQLTLLDKDQKIQSLQFSVVR